ncbi:MAG: DUF348 domain-containing protein [Endomicrobiales bacterium]|nr:DUF348 domain-containing protein [Endomicrobiales bacterium]
MKISSLKKIRIFIYIGIASILLLSFWGAYFYYSHTVTILADGRKKIVYSRPVTVAEALKKEGVSIGKNDMVSPALTSVMPRHGTIEVTRVSEEIKEEKDVLPFIVRWSQKYTRNLRPVELQKGTQKTRIKKVKKTYHNGKTVKETILRERTTYKTIYRLALLAKDGSTEQIYDLSRAKKMKMIATAYYPGDPLAWKDGTITFLGLKMQRGIVAVDPGVIPLKTRVYVPGFGYGYAGDTGSAIKGNRIDLGVNDAEEEKQFMHRRVTVYLLEESETW